MAFTDEGLRMLIVGKRVMKMADFKAWKRTYDEVRAWMLWRETFTSVSGDCSEWCFV